MQNPSLSGGIFLSGNPKDGSGGGCLNGRQFAAIRGQANTSGCGCTVRNRTPQKPIPLLGSAEHLLSGAGNQPEAKPTSNNTSPTIEEGIGADNSGSRFRGRNSRLHRFPVYGEIGRVLYGLRGCRSKVHAVPGNNSSSPSHNRPQMIISRLSTGAGSIGANDFASTNAHPIVRCRRAADHLIRLKRIIRQPSVPLLGPALSHSFKEGVGAVL